MGDIIVIAGVIAICVLSVRSLIRNKKEGGCAGCSGYCSNCPEHQKRSLS